MIYLNEILFLGPGLFRTILIIAVVYYLIKFIRKIVVPIFNPPQQRPSNFQQQNNRPEGDITVEKNKDNDSRTSKDDGEYIDFEEVD